MIKKNLFVFVVVGLFVHQARGLETKLFKNTDSFPKALLLRDYKKPAKLKKISQIKWFQNNGQFQKCAQTAETLNQNQRFGVWIPYVHVSCLKSWLEQKKSVKIKKALKSFQALERNKQLLLNSPFSGHQEKILSVFLELAKLSSEKARGQFESLIRRNADLVDYMSKKQRASYYQIMGEFAWLRQKNEIAKANFLRSYGFQKDSTVLKRLKSLKVDSLLRLDKYSKDFIQSKGEIDLWEKFSRASRKGQTYKVAKYGSEFLNKYPGSLRIDDVREGMNSFYKRLLYRRGKKYIASKNDYEKQLMKAPPQYILYWATEAYERGYQKSSHRLAEKAARLWGDHVQAAEALILAARSAFYLVKRSKAEKYLEALIEKHSGHKASQEAQYLLGLIYYRDEEYKKLINLYDQFLLSEGSDKWELQVRYWLYRSFKKIKSSRAKEMADALFANFPLTYYGLRVRMEEKGGLQGLLSKDLEEITASLWWTNHNKSRWQRVKKMIEAGWLDEAESEIDFMPDPQLASGFIIRAKVWQSAGLFNRAIKDYASAIDIDHSYMSRELLKTAFPKEYSSGVLSAEKEFSISQNLIWSIIRQESAFMPRAISPSKAYGLMQLLSPTAKETAKWLKVKKFKMPYDIFKPNQNIRFGTHFISRMMRKYKGVAPLAIASYNVGPGNLDRWLSHRTDLKDWHLIGASPDDDIWMDELPWAETSFYVKAVLRNYLLYKIIHEELNQLDSPPWKQAKLK